jgi:hypothetical protein
MRREYPNEIGFSWTVQERTQAGLTGIFQLRTVQERTRAGVMHIFQLANRALEPRAKNLESAGSENTRDLERRPAEVNYSDSAESVTAVASLPLRAVEGLPLSA